MSMRIRTATGVRVLSPRLPLEVAAPEGVRPGYRELLRTAIAIRAAVPARSASAMLRAVEIFKTFLSWAGIPETQVTGDVVCAFLASRAAPSVACPLPRHRAWTSPVLPATAASDVDLLRYAFRRDRYAKCRLLLHKVIGTRERG